MKRLINYSILLLCICAIFVSAQEKQFSIPYEKYTLSNGMNVILHVDKSDPIAAVYVVYHVGSAREEKGKTGFAHLFEHLRFNESQDIPQGLWFKKLQTAGASIINGSTNEDRTNYFEVVPKNAIEMALWMESDRMGFLLSKVNEKTFVTQQNVVQNEKRQGDNRPYSQVEYMMAKLMFPENHPYSHTVIGSLNDLSNASLKDVFNFHDKYYAPSNATLVVAGDIDVSQIKKWIEKYFAEIKSAPAPKPLPKADFKLGEIKKSYYEDNLASAPQLTISFPTVEDFSKDSYALDFFGRIFAGSKKSPLYKVIVEERKLAPQVFARQSSSELSGTFDITITTFPNVKLGDVEDAVKEAFARFEKDSFTEKDVDREKPGLEYRFYNSIASVLGKSMRLADYNIFEGSPDYIKIDFQNMMSVTKDNVLNTYNKYIKGQNYLALSIVPKGKAELAVPNSNVWVAQEESIEKQGAQKKEIEVAKYEPIPSKIDRTKEPVKGPDPVVNPPKIWTSKTDNGIPVYGIKYNELPLVQFSILLKGGMLLDDPNKIGTAYLTASLMNEGTKNKTPIELKEAMQELGANISIGSTSEFIFISGSCLTSKLDETFALAKEMLFEPRWDEKEFAISKSRTMEELKRMEFTPTAISRNVFNKLIYGADNILSNEPNGTQKSIGSISINDLRNYYDKYFSPSVSKLTIIGDVSKDKAVSLFNGLKDWKAKIVKLPKINITNSTKSGIYFVDVPNAKQSVFNVGHLGLDRKDPDFYKAFVMNYKLGGDFSGILNMILREQKSYTYGASSGFSGSMYPGTFDASTQVQSNATMETAQIIKDEIAKYHNGISADDLNLVKSTLLKSNAGRFETIGNLSQMLYPIVMYDLPLDYIKRNQAIIQKMTTEEQKSLAQKYLQPNSMIFVIVGDKATQFDRLKNVGLGDPILIDKDGKSVN